MFATIMNYDAYVRRKGLPIINSADKSSPTGLFSPHVFGVTETEKLHKPALIQLHTFVMRPLFVANFKVINRKIVSCITTKEEHYIRNGEVFKIDSNYVSEPNDIIGHGPSFLYTHWDKLDKKQWKQDHGRYSNKEMKLAITKFTRDQVFKNYQYVVPLPFREEDQDTAIMEKDINRLLSDIINYSNACKMAGLDNNTGISVNKVDVEILLQNAIIAYGEFVVDRYLGPKGVGRKQIMSRAVDNSSRNVILPMVWNNPVLGKGQVKNTQIGLPIHQVIQMFRDTVVKFSKNFIEYLHAIGKFPDGTSADMLAYYDIEYLTNMIDKMEDPFSRVQPFPAVNADGTAFEPITLSFLVKEPDGREELVEKHLYWIEFFYIVCITYIDITNRRGTATTRYPVDSNLSQQYVNPVPLTLSQKYLKTVTVLDHTYEDFFPFVTDAVADMYDYKIFEQGIRLPASITVGFNGKRVAPVHSNMSLKVC